ncbi:MAG: 3-dehydroquinate synthase [Bacillota bacterium]
MNLEVKGVQSPYPVRIEQGLLKTLGTYMDRNKTYVLLTDTGIPKEYVKQVEKTLAPIKTITVRQGENSKSMTTYEEVLLSMQALNLQRSAHLVALGGGVVSDLGGFVAATYKRGIDFTILPTTLLSMVDASVGGKVAINTQYAKNSVGTFYTPKQVLIDPDTLNTLPRREFNSGMAEVIKSALIKDRVLFNDLKTPFDKLDIDTIIYKSLTVKKAFVESDLKDKGERQILNYGHTIGHAVEKESDFSLLHGECIAIGMKLMARDKPFYDELIDVLKTHGLNLSIPQSMDVDALLNHIKEDKKVFNDTYHIIDVKKVGNGFIKTSSAEEIKRIIKGDV